MRATHGVCSRQGTQPEPERYDIAPYYFDSCKRLSGSGLEKDRDVTLEDDLQQILFGEEREFHHESIPAAQ